MKSKVDNLDIDMLAPAPVELSKLSDVVKHDVAEKDVYNSKIKDIPDITNLAANTTPNAKINEVKNKLRGITNLATNIALNAEINEVQNKIPNITNLDTTTTTAALIAVKSKITIVRNLVKKNNYNSKFSEIENKISTSHDHDEYITTQEFNNLISENWTARLAQANLASKSNIANFVKKTDFADKLKNLNKNVFSK